MTPSLMLALAIAGQSCPGGRCPLPVMMPIPSVLAGPQGDGHVYGEQNYYLVTASDGLKYRVWGRPRRRADQPNWEIDWDPKSQPAGYPQRIGEPSAPPERPEPKPPAIGPGVDLSHEAKSPDPVVHSNLPPAELAALVPEVAAPRPIVASGPEDTARNRPGGLLGRLNPLRQKQAESDRSSLIIAAAIVIGLVVGARMIASANAAGDE